MVDGRAPIAGDAGGNERRTNCCGRGHELSAVGRRDFEGVLSNEKEPISCPRDISSEGSITRHVDGRAGAQTETGDIGDGYPSVLVELRGNCADWRFNAMLAGLDAPHVSERGDQADGSVAAHAEIAYVIEEDDARGRFGIDGIAEQGTDDDLRTSRFADDASAEVVEFLAKSFPAFSQGSVAEIGSPRDNHTRRLPFRVGVDDIYTAPQPHVVIIT